MKKLINATQQAILGMANVRGRYVKNPGKLDFSFYFSSGVGVAHDIRVKPSFNPERLILSQAGTLKLCDDWEFIPGLNDKNISKKDVDIMIGFFRYNLALFCAVWDEQLSDGVLEDWFLGRNTFLDVMKDLTFYHAYQQQLDQITDAEEFEKFCRDTHLVNLHEN